MLKIYLAAGLLFAVSSAANATCTTEFEMTRATEIMKVVGDNAAHNPDAATGILTELGTIVNDPKATDATCTKLDDLMVRAKKL